MIQLAIASGKGGTGKTTVSTNLAHVFARRLSVQYLDCDVEAPNGHLFLKPTIERTIAVSRLVPVIDQSVCQHAGACSALCQYHALAALPHQTIVYPELCRGCGGCVKVCPSGAIREEERSVGTVAIGSVGPIHFAQGRMKVREIATVPIIRAVRKQLNGSQLSILDAPPGTACPMAATIRGVDAVVLVTNPTPFALHDLELALRVVGQFGPKVGVVINRAGTGDSRVRRFCQDAGLPIWGQIPDDRRMAEAYSESELIYEAVPRARACLDEIAGAIASEVM